MPSQISSQADLFEIPADVTYLNCANMSPQLRSVTSAGFESVAAKREPWKTDWFSGAEKFRTLTGKLLNCGADSISVIPSVSYGIAVAASNSKVEKGQSIVLLHEEFPSNYYVWDRIARERGAEIRLVRRPEGEGWTASILAAIDESTAVVSVPNCHWTDGSFVDLDQIGERARQVGAVFIVDASQSMGARPIDVQTLRPDFLVSVGYKWMMGPYSLAYLYASENRIPEGRPIEESWLNHAGYEDFTTLVYYKDQYPEGARRFDMGEFPNLVLIPMANAALTQILEWGVENIQFTLSRLTSLIAENAEALGCSVLNERNRIGHLIGIRLPNGIPATLTSELEKSRIYVSLRGESIRIAPHLYNTDTDIEKLFDVLKRIV